MSKQFKYKIKIYYEDTDAGGIVYHANYLKFLERARSDAMHSMGLSNRKLFEKYKILIFVKSCDIIFNKPVKLEDEIQILSSVKSSTRTSFTMSQIIKIKKEIAADAVIRLVTVNLNNKPIKIPKILKGLLNF